MRTICFCCCCKKWMKQPKMVTKIINGQKKRILEQCGGVELLCQEHNELYKVDNQKRFYNRETKCSAFCIIHQMSI